MTNIWIRFVLQDTITICLQNEIAVNRRNSGDIGRNSSACHPTLTVFPTDVSRRAIIISFRKQIHECKTVDYYHSNNPYSLQMSKNLYSGSLPGIAASNIETKSFPSRFKYSGIHKQMTPRYGTSFYSE